MTDPPSTDVVYWRQRCEWLQTDCNRLKQRNELLEERMLGVVERVETDKLALSTEIDELSRRLTQSSNRALALEQECARYKKDCVLAVHLLQCQPGHYMPNPRVAELPSTVGNRVTRKTTRTTVSTFPPMAVFLTPDEEVDQPEDPEPPGIVPSPVTKEMPRSPSFADSFVERIRTDDDYSCSALRQCATCGRSVTTATRGTQVALPVSSRKDVETPTGNPVQIV